MTVTTIARSETDSITERLFGDATVVVVPIWNASDETIRCVESLNRHTDVAVPFLLIDDCGEDRRSLDVVHSFFSDHPRQIVIIDMEVNSGFVVACNTAFELTNGDLALVNSDVVVGPEWFSRLQQAAKSSSDIATASALTNYGTILSVPHRNSPNQRVENGISVDDAATRVAASSRRLYPRIPVAVGHCMFINRIALNIAGGFDNIFGRGYGEEVDFSNRLRRIGLRHVCADDVFVFHKGSASFGEKDSPQKQANDARINTIYTWYEPFVRSYAENSYSPLAQAILIASLSLRDPRIAIDATSLGKFWAGTQQNVFNLLLSLARVRPDLEITALVRPNLPDRVVENLKRPGNITLEAVERIDLDQDLRFDLVYRPNQINNATELTWIKRIALRAVVCQLDLISYHNASYHATPDEWMNYRDLTHLTLASVDGATWISNFALRDSQNQGLGSSLRTDCVTYMGVDHQPLEKSYEAKRPRGAPDDGIPFILQLGVAYHHKNRVFSLKVLRHLLDQGWNGRLILASAMPVGGSSYGTEAEIHLQDPRLRHHLIELGEVTENERNWLVSQASLALYPSVAEGFGLLPFEFALDGLTTLSSRVTSLEEIIPADIVHIERFDPRETATQILRLLNDDRARAELASALTTKAGEFSWTAAAEKTWSLFDEVLRQPRNPTHAVNGARLVTELFDHRPKYKNPKKAKRVEGVDSTVGKLSLNPLKKFLIPDGSQRQNFARAMINRIRRRGLTY